MKRKFQRFYSSVVNQSLSIAKGFKVQGVSGGIKKGKLDLAIFHSTKPARCAGVFTQNKFRASCIDINHNVLSENSENISAVVISSGNANAVTGKKGWDNSMKMQEMTASSLGVDPESILVLNTGVIGRQLPMDAVQNGISLASAQLEDTEDGWVKAAKAICTTDKMHKLEATRVTIGGQEVNITGVAKGAGMIHPNMATMLGFVATDANISSACLDHALRIATDKSFHAISVDGDTSTNDCVLLMASGEAGGAEITETSSSEFAIFQAGLNDVCTRLAQQIVVGSEGARKLVSVTIYSAKDQDDARLASKTVATSILTRCALFGGEPNWGRILCAVGYSGAEVDTNAVNLWMTSPYPNFENRKCYLVENGVPTEDPEVLKECSEMIQQEKVDIHIDLAIGSAQDTVWFPELSTDYVVFNSEYLT